MQRLEVDITDISCDALVSKTLDGIVIGWSAGAETLFGYTAEEMIGRPILRLFPADRRQEEDAILARLKAGERIEQCHTLRVAKDGRGIEVSLTIIPIRDHTGRVVGALKTVATSRINGEPRTGAHAVRWTEKRLLCRRAKKDCIRRSPRVKRRRRRCARARTDSDAHPRRRARWYSRQTFGIEPFQRASTG